jgi:cytidine deaminase
VSDHRRRDGEVDGIGSDSADPTTAWPSESTSPDAVAAVIEPEVTMPSAAPELESLLRAATAAQQRAYAPYSRFRVGAAVWGEGQLFIGANVENSSYGLTICAERAAVSHAVAAGVRQLTAVAVCTDASPPSSPCGACRQVLREFAVEPRTFRVIAIHHDGARREWTLEELLPDSFSGAELLDTTGRTAARPDDERA